MRGHHRAGTRRSQRISGMIGLVLLGAASFLTAVPAHAQDRTGEVRLGHLSPSTPAVDVYLTAPGAPASREPVVADAGYGAVTGYQPLAVGRWTVEMRPTGASPDTVAPLTAAIDVSPGSAQSLLFFDTGPGGEVQGQLVTDDLAPASAGSGRVRVVQGADSVAPVEMQAIDGPRLATGLEYGTVTDYATVDARSWNVAIASGDQSLQATLDVTAGSVSTVVLTRDTSGALEVTPLVDVAGITTAVPGTTPEATGPATPQGGVPAGAGGAAGGPDPAPVLLGLIGAVLLVFGLSGGFGDLGRKATMRQRIGSMVAMLPRSSRW